MIRRWLCKILCRCSPARRMGFIFVGQGIETMSFNIQQGVSKTFALALSNAAGVNVPLPSGVVPAWACDPPAALSLSPAADGMSCPFTAGTTDGPFTVTATTTYADGDVVTATIAGNVVDPEDTQGTITVQ